MLFIDSHFCSREFCRRDEGLRGMELNLHREKLENACWAGLLFEMIPELVALNLTGEKAFIRDIHTAGHFMLINRGMEAEQVEEPYSLDPYLFLNKNKAN